MMSKKLAGQAISESVYVPLYKISESKDFEKITIVSNCVLLGGEQILTEFMQMNMHFHENKNSH